MPACYDSATPPLLRDGLNMKSSESPRAARDPPASASPELLGSSTGGGGGGVETCTRAPEKRMKTRIMVKQQNKYYSRWIVYLAHSQEPTMITESDTGCDV
jgi:hypothetical protein